MNVFEEFQWRDAIHANTEGLPEYLQKEKVTAYAGFDPSASSLHVGSLLPIMGLARLQRFGHNPIGIVGGGTGMIGDPSGKTAERLLLSKDQIAENISGIRSQLEYFLDFENKKNPARLVNNADWLANITMVDFLRDVGKHFTINFMMAKESIKKRYEQQQGISYAEFSYLLLQSYDFFKLNEKYDCTLQIGGSDQWGNITSGIDLIRKLRPGNKAYGLTFPLVTSSSGVKFGKTEAGTIWLDPKRTSPYRFYQFWMNTVDADVIRYLKYFTWLDKETVDGLEQGVKTEPERREAQKTLAREMTLMLHGQDGLGKAELATKIFFGAEIENLSGSEALDIFADVPSTEVARSQLQDGKLSIVDMLTVSEAANSKGAARRLLKGGGVYLNNRKVPDENYSASLNEAIDGKIFVLRKGKKNYHLIKITE